MNIHDGVSTKSSQCMLQCISKLQLDTVVSQFYAFDNG